MAQIALDAARADLELLPRKKKLEPLTLTRCPVCKGLRTVALKHVGRAGPCRDCRSGRVIRRSEFYAFWTERFSQDEIDAMARAIWG